MTGDRMREDREDWAARERRDFPDPPIPVRAGSRATVAVIVAAWGLLVVSVPLYAAFLLGNLPDVLVMVSNLQASAAQRRAARLARRVP